MLHGPQVDIVASLVTVWTLATAAIILRLVAKRMAKVPFWLDDYSCLAAYLLGTTYNAWVVVCTASLIETPCSFFLLRSFSTMV